MIKIMMIKICIFGLVCVVVLIVLIFIFILLVQVVEVLWVVVDLVFYVEIL